jgi:hypothetical protein
VTASGLVTLHVWEVPRRRVPAAVLRMASDRAPLQGMPGLRFGKLLGTGTGRTFTPADADPTRWGILACWTSSGAADRFEHSEVVARWDAAAKERLRVAMVPLASRGRWSGREPFAFGGAAAVEQPDGPVAAVTRARLAPRRAVAFWRATPPVVAELGRADGLVLSFGIGEAPIGLQGTFSVWRSIGDLRAFAYRTAAHVEAIGRSAAEGWYAEELFASLAVVAADGSHRGRPLHVKGA